MLSPEQVDYFFDREFRNTDRWKNADVEVVKKWLFEKLEWRPRFRFPPYEHQWVCVAIGLTYKRFMFALDMGTGKSKIVIDVFRYRRLMGECKRMLVLVPNLTNLAGWREQVELHGEGLTVDTLSVGSRAKREVIWRGDANVVVVTYAGARALLCGKVSGYKGTQPLKAAIAECHDMFDFVICDESSVLAKVQTITFKMMKAICRKEDMFLYLLTGSLFGKDPQALWPQMYLLDRGWLLGATLSVFRQCLFREKETPWGRTEWVLRAGMRKVLHTMLRHSSIRYSESECLDLPERVGGMDNPMLVQCDFTNEQWNHYDSIELDARATFKTTGETVPQAYMEKRRILSGYFRNDRGGFTRLKKNPKLEALLELLADLDREHPTEKIIIVHHYQETGDAITDALGKRPHVTLRGGSSDRGLQRFQKDPKVRTLVASKAAAFGLNLQMARIMIFVESPDSREVREQMERRIYRAGQTKATYYYDIVIRNSLDEDILGALQKNKSVWRAVVEGESAR